MKKILIPSAILVLTIGGFILANQSPKPVPKADQAVVKPAPTITIIPGPSAAPVSEVPVGETPVTKATSGPASPAPTSDPASQPTPQPAPPTTAPTPPETPPASVFTIYPGTP